MRIFWALSLGCAVSPGCGLPEGDYFGKVDPEPDPTHVRWCNLGEPEHLDPALATSTTALPLSYALFDGLTDHDLDGSPKPSLATYWDISPDQRRFTFYLHDQGRWSNGRPITAHDVAYHLERVLHPLSFSRNAEPLWKLKNGQLYTEGRVKMVLRDVPPLRAGDVVEVLGVAGNDAQARAPEITDDVTGSGNVAPIAPAGPTGAGASLPDSNLRVAAAPLRLRDQGASESEAYAIVPAGQAVTIIDLAGKDNEWAYVHWAEEDGVYGWVRTDALTHEPNGDVAYWVRPVPEPHRVGVDMDPRDIAAALAAERPMVMVRGKDLLMLPEVLGVRVPSDHVLVLETFGPVPYFIDMTSHVAFRPTPAEAVSRRPMRWTMPATIITSGPFHLEAWHERDRLELVKSPTYWNKDQVKVARFTSYSMDDQAASTNYYMQGGCDALAPNHIPTSYLQALSGEKRGKPYKDYTVAPYLGIYFILVNTEKITNVHLRRALSHAIDRSIIPRLLHGGQIPTVQHTPGTPISQLGDEELALCGVTRDTPGVVLMVSPGELCYVPPPGLAYDVEQARHELALARQEMGAKFPTTITYKFNTGVESHKLIAEYVQHEWKEVLGLDIELMSQEWKTYLKSTAAGEYELGRFGNIGNFPDPEAEFMSLFKCNAPHNRAQFCHPDFERLIALAEATADRKERLSLIRKAEEVLVAEAPVIPIYVYTQQQLKKPYVRDLVVNFSNKQPLDRIWIDPGWQRAAAGGK